MNIIGLRRALKELAGVRSSMAPFVADAVTARLRVGFLSGVDPYGSPWAPLRPATLAKGRHPPPLTDTGKLSSGTRGKPMRGSGVAIIVPDLHYAGYHMTGTSRMAARPYLPTKGLPATWRDDIRFIFANALRQGLR
jgi:hypothetical protein